MLGFVTMVQSFAVTSTMRSPQLTTRVSGEHRAASAMQRRSLACPAPFIFPLLWRVGNNFRDGCLTLELVILSILPCLVVDRPPFLALVVRTNMRLGAARPPQTGEIELGFVLCPCALCFASSCGGPLSLVLCVFNWLERALCLVECCRMVATHKFLIALVIFLTPCQSARCRGVGVGALPSGMGALVKRADLHSARGVKIGGHGAPRGPAELCSAILADPEWAALSRSRSWDDT